MLVGRSEGAPVGRTRTAESIEPLGYVVIALAIFALLAWHASQVDRFYLDEWLYVHGAQDIWDNLPLGPIEPIANWTRGPQRLYPSVLSVLWGPMSAPTAFLLSHLLNAALLASAVWPTALLARRMIDAPAARILAVALATVIPWLVISANLLTENLAFPLFLWSLYAITRAAERPTAASQIVALLTIGALTACRLNLGLLLAVLAIAVVVSEAMGRRDASTTSWFGGFARRRWPLLIGISLGSSLALAVAAGAGGGLGAYANVLDVPVLSALFGDRAADTGRSLLTILRALLTGAFVLPVVLGLAAGLAALRGALGRDRVVPAVVLLSSAVGVVVLVAVTSATFGYFEERYVFYAYPPVALLAVAGLPRVSRLAPELLAASAAVVLALRSGEPAIGAASDNFFVAPAGVFWTRVVEWRLRRTEDMLLGWAPGERDGWLLVAVALVALVVAVVVLTRWTRAALVASLALCVIAQAATLTYDYDKLLNGTAETPGGLAGEKESALERDDWIDAALPNGGEAALIPAQRGVVGPWGGAEREQMFNRRIDAVVSLSFTNAATPAPPGHAVLASVLDDGLATLPGSGYEWLVAEPHDPRVQFGGRFVRRSMSSPYALWRIAPPDRALWTATGLESDATLIRNVPVRLRFDRGRARDVRTVAITLGGLEGAPEAARWAITRSGKRVDSGRADPGVERVAHLRVPRCKVPGACPVASWILRAVGPVTPLPLPGYGAPGEPRKTVMRMPAVRLLDCVSC